MDKKEDLLDREIATAAEEINEHITFKFENIEESTSMSQREFYKRVIKTAFDGNLLADIVEGK